MHKIDLLVGALKHLVILWELHTCYTSLSLDRYMHVKDYIAAHIHSVPVLLELAALYRPRSMGLQLTVNMFLTNKWRNTSYWFLNSIMQVSKNLFFWPFPLFFPPLSLHSPSFPSLHLPPLLLPPPPYSPLPSSPFPLFPFPSPPLFLSSLPVLNASSPLLPALSSPLRCVVLNIQCTFNVQYCILYTW